ncbi:hypothetical protein [Filimonas effusa]|uniref:Uncharacterized protein n=1 Tax=Filimonas effusa TaxID=2508721 RepID=A0A4Q1D963_9BACT|nr:hypothetical protein [Filimonas effusa]RXK85902.1 hypothetical protein ESB13_03575 [Filimonas effusa]
MNVKILKRVLLMLLLGVLVRADAQLTLVLQVPPAGVVQKSQLWNMALVSGSDVGYDVEVNLTLISTVDNNPVLTATGRVITITKGARQLKYTDFVPVKYTYLSSAFNVDQRPEGFLPLGSYTACYTVSAWGGHAEGPLVEDCIQLDVQPLSPPVLNTPLDKDTVETAYPQFTWLPPAPLSLLNDLTYDFILVKMLPDMTPAQAIQQNIPVYNQAHVRQPFLNFPATTTALDTGIVYAWGVIAKNAGQFVAVSDAWTFRYVTKVFPKETAEASYVQLKREEDGIPVSVSDTLKFVYSNFSSDSTVAFTIAGLSDPDNQLMAKGTFTAQAGENRVQIPVKFGWGLRRNDTYLLTVINAEGEKRLMKFIIKEK